MFTPRQRACSARQQLDCLVLHSPVMSPAPAVLTYVLPVCSSSTVLEVRVRESPSVQITCQQTPARPNSNSMYGNGGVWPPQQVEPAESLCRACNISRYTFEPPSIFCTSCQQRIKRNQVRCAFPVLLVCLLLCCWHCATLRSAM